MRTSRIAEIIKERTSAKWFDCVQAANDISITLEAETSLNKEEAKVRKLKK